MAPRRDHGASGSDRLTEARKLKQQAERKPVGEARESCLSRSAGHFEAVLQLSNGKLPEHEYMECVFDLAETYYLHGSSVRTYVSGNSVSPLRPGNITKAAVIDLRVKAFMQSAGLFRKSFETYAKVTLGELKEEAVVNSANALCDLAEVLLEVPEEAGGGLKVAVKLYSDAYDRYSAALSRSGNDLEILTNLGDCCIRRAELILQEQGSCPEAGHFAGSLYDQAMQMYNHACSLADSRKGDDLPGLLQNWGAGLVSKAQNVTDYVEALKLLSAAREKLTTATQLSPTDANLLNALADLCIRESEKFPDEPAFYEKAYSCMLAAIEHFTAALRINSENTDANIGSAEAHQSAARSMRLAGNSQQAHFHALQSTTFYLKSIELLKSETECRSDVDFTQQCDILFNLACVAARCGQEAVAQSSLKQLVHVRAVSMSDLVNDEDLESYKSKDWYRSLLNTLENGKP